MIKILLEVENNASSYQPYTSAYASTSASTSASASAWPTQSGAKRKHPEAIVNVEKDDMNIDARFNEFYRYRVYRCV